MAFMELLLKLRKILLELAFFGVTQRKNRYSNCWPYVVHFLYKTLKRALKRITQPNTYFLFKNIK
jgi:hypothetical protein